MIIFEPGESGTSKIVLIYKRNKSGPNTDPCGTPETTGTEALVEHNLQQIAANDVKESWIDTRTL